MAGFVLLSDPMQTQEDLMEFFTFYGRNFRDPRALGRMYGESAMISTPSFVGCLKGRAEIDQAMKAAATYQGQTGLISLEPRTVEKTEIDDLHILAKVRWEAKFQKTGDRPIHFDISYLIRDDLSGPHILLYVSHQDEMEMRSKLGLL